jgi:hypothetical protein
VFSLLDNSRPYHSFNTTEIRPCNKEVSNPLPSPAEYFNAETFKGMLVDLKGKALVGRQGAFGCVDDRFRGFALNAKKLGFDGGTDAGVYEPQIHQAEGDATKAVFASTKPRFKEPPGVREPNADKIGLHKRPGPGDYRPNDKPNYSNPYRTPRRDHVGFGLSTAARSEVAGIVHGSKPSTNPGPGEYEIKPEKIKGPGQMSARDRFGGHDDYRSRNETGEVGPGAYEANSFMIKKTHNVTTDLPYQAGGSTASREASVYGSRSSPKVA